MDEKLIILNKLVEILVERSLNLENVIKQDRVKMAGLEAENVKLKSMNGKLIKIVEDEWGGTDANPLNKPPFKEPPSGN